MSTISIGRSVCIRAIRGLSIATLPLAATTALGAAAAVAPPAAYGQFISDDSASPLPPVVTPQWWPAPPAGSAATTEQDPRRAPERLASFPRDVTEPLLDQPDNFVLLPEIQQVKPQQQRDGFFQR